MEWKMWRIIIPDVLKACKLSATLEPFRKLFIIDYLPRRVKDMYD